MFPLIFTKNKPQHTILLSNRKNLNQETLRMPDVCQRALEYLHFTLSRNVEIIALLYRVQLNIAASLSEGKPSNGP